MYTKRKTGYMILKPDPSNAMLYAGLYAAYFLLPWTTTNHPSYHPGNHHSNPGFQSHCKSMHESDMSLLTKTFLLFLFHNLFSWVSSEMYLQRSRKQQS